MQPVAIVVADAARARLFTYKREDDQAPAPVFRQRGDLARDGEAPSGPPGRANTLDDGGGHADETERRFAAQVIERVAALTRDAACTRVALVAPPRFLGRLREHAAALRGISVDEVARDLTHEAPPKLRDHLASLGILPAPR